MRERTKGFLTGVTAAALVAGLGFGALAAGRSITVQDGVAIEVDGATLVARDAQGAVVSAFTYNGTTYAPVRAIANALGVTVRYDAATNTAVFTSPDAASSGEYIGAEKAKAIALERAPNATVYKAKFDFDDGVPLYEIDLRDSTYEYECDVHALTGAVLSWKQEKRDDVQTATGSYIGEERAKAIAQAKAPNATIYKCELDFDDGRAVYEIKLRGGKKYDCEIDAVTGEVLKWEQD